MADIISWVVGQICMFSQKGSSSACVRVCECVFECVCVRERENKREKKVSSGHNKKLSYSLWFQMNKESFSEMIQSGDYENKATHTHTHMHRTLSHTH